MLKRLISAYVASRALAQDMTSGPCPQYCFVNTTGPQLSSTQFQGPVFYKNKPYMATIAPYQYLMLADNASSSVRPNIYNFDKWIFSEQALVGQTYSSSKETIMVGFECQPEGKAFANITTDCMDTIMYMNPEFCSSDYMMATYRSDLACPTPTMSSSPTQQVQPGTGSVIQTSMSPTSTGINRDTVSLSATMTSMPTRQIQYSMSPTGSSKTNSATSEEPTAEPTKREEQTAEPTKREEQTAEPTKREEPTAEPTKHEEPTAEPTKREEPTAEPTKREEPSAEPTHRPTLRPEEPSAKPTSRPTPTAAPTRRPNAPSDKPTPRPTYSALPTRRPTPSTMPTRMFRSPPPVEMTKTLKSQIRIETRNESLFQNPKNVEAVVKTIVCTLNVPSETVQVSGIQHFVDNILIAIIPVPQINRSRNFSDKCIKEQQPKPDPTPIPQIEPQAEPRRLQSGLDTYVVQYQVQDPPASVTELEPATMATMMQTAPTLVNSLDIPIGSYVAITAEQPTYSQAQQNQQVQQTENSILNNTLMGVFIPIGIVAVGSIIAMTIKRKEATNTRPIRITTIMNQQPQAQAFVQTNPTTRIIGIPSRSTMEPMKIRSP